MEWFSQHIELTALAVLAILVVLCAWLHVGLGWGWFWACTPIWILLILALLFGGLFLWLVFQNFVVD